jgi:shikimate kinase
MTMAQANPKPETPLIPQISSALANVISDNPKTAPTTSRIFLTGVGCVGKTTIGTKLASLLGYRFYDLDHEVEALYQLSLARLQKQHKSMDEFRIAAAKVLGHILLNPASHHCVVALSPRGLMDAYWKVVRRTKATTVVLQDKPEHILNRLTFFDIDSRPMTTTLSARERQLYLKEIKADISYFRRSYNKATMFVDISSLNIDESARKIQAELEAGYN